MDWRNAFIIKFKCVIFGSVELYVSRQVGRQAGFWSWELEGRSWREGVGGGKDSGGSKEKKGRGSNRSKILGH